MSVALTESQAWTLDYLRYRHEVEGNRFVVVPPGVCSNARTLAVLVERGLVQSDGAGFRAAVV